MFLRFLTAKFARERKEKKLKARLITLGLYKGRIFSKITQFDKSLPSIENSSSNIYRASRRNSIINFYKYLSAITEQ